MDFVGIADSKIHATIVQRGPRRKCASRNAPKLGFDLVVAQRRFRVGAVMLQALLDFAPLVIGEGRGFLVDGFPDAFDEVEAFLHA